MDSALQMAVAELVPTAVDMAASLVLDHQSVELCVRAPSRQCWSCARTSPAIGVVHVEGFTSPHQVIRVVEGIELEYAKDLLTLAGSPLASTIKLRYSRTMSGQYLASGCLYCDAIFGAFYTHEDITTYLAADAVATMPLVAQVARPQLEYFLLKAIVDAEP